MIYIMRRTQLYLDDDLWNALHAIAESSGTSISELVRQAVRERYVGKLEERRKAMQAFVGIRQDRSQLSQRRFGGAYPKKRIIEAETD